MLLTLLLRFVILLDIDYLLNNKWLLLFNNTLITLFREIDSRFPIFYRSNTCAVAVVAAAAAAAAITQAIDAKWAGWLVEWGQNDCVAENSMETYCNYKCMSSIAYVDF